MATDYPRLNSLKSFFAETASGKAGMPEVAYAGTVSLFSNDQPSINFYKYHQKLRGVFDKHFYSSIPYVLEEECRIGATILGYLNSHRGTQFLYVMGAAEGTMARTIGYMGNGHIKTLSCSPTKENEQVFYKHGASNFSFFKVAPYMEITNEDINSIIHDYNEFDFIFEDTTFQMYSSNRFEQVKLTKQKLKEDGIIGFLEKFSQEDISEFTKREEIKDKYFKKRFFDKTSIEEKKSAVLNDMNKGLVTLDQFSITLKKFFNYAIVIWNSGNFYTVIASNSKDNLLKFSNDLPSSFTPKLFVNTTTPLSLFGIKDFELRNRNFSVSEEMN